jgi:predicted DNA-binding transcriptional regulator YafY
VPAEVVRALADQRLLEIEYLDRLRAATSRSVDPIGRITVAHHWYLVAWCRLRGDNRAFRLDRIRRATVHLEAATGRPAVGWDCDAPVRLRELAIEA